MPQMTTDCLGQKKKKTVNEGKKQNLEEQQNQADLDRMVSSMVKFGAFGLPADK